MWTGYHASGKCLGVLVPHKPSWEDVRCKEDLEKKVQEDDKRSRDSTWSNEEGDRR